MRSRKVGNSYSWFEYCVPERTEASEAVEDGEERAD